MIPTMPTPYIRVSDNAEKYRKQLIAKAQASDVGIVHIFDPDNPQGGLTIAFRKTEPFPNTNMVEVAVATCSKADTFNRKVGTGIALSMFFNGETINLPLLNKDNRDDINGAVKIAFTRMFPEYYF